MADRASEKQASRAEDARRLAAGEVSLQELRRENSFIVPPADFVIDYDNVKPARYRTRTEEK